MRAGSEVVSRRGSLARPVAKSAIALLIVVSAACNNLDRIASPPPPRSGVRANSSFEGAYGGDGKQIIIVSRLGSDRCIDDPGGSTVSGTSVQISTCTEATNQRFMWFPDGSIKIFAGTFDHKCLDGGAAYGLGNPITIWDCEYGPEQLWDTTASGQIRNRAYGTCLVVDGGNPANGTHLNLAPCAAQSSQQWDTRLLIGYNLGFTYNSCTTNLVDDTDADGLSNSCEYTLAQAFSPELVIHTDDDFGRESAYAVRPVGGSSVKIFYLLAYHRDVGLKTLGGFTLLPHSGDSEFLELTVQETGGRWYLSTAFLSAHYGTSVDKSSYLSYSALAFGDLPRGKPRIWVSWGKHANYRSQSACNSVQDDCGTNTYIWPADLFPGRNIGSNAVRLMDCVQSMDPNYYDGTECFWTVRTFNGWYGNSYGGGATAYSTLLNTFGWVY